MRERKPVDGWFVVVVFVVTFACTLALRGTGLGWWAQLGVQATVLLVALLAWSRWLRRR